MTVAYHHSRRGIRLALTAALFGTLASRSALAGGTGQAVHEGRDGAYYGGHLALTGVGLIAAAVFEGMAPPKSDEDHSTMLGVANGLFGFELILPIPAIASKTHGELFGNALLVYAEPLALGAAVANGARALHAPMGHSVVAFASAVTGSYLFTEVARPLPAVRSGYWGFELGLATLSTYLRARGGTDGIGAPLLATGGAILGTGIGLMAVGINGGRLALRQSDGVGIGAGLAAPLLVALLWPGPERPIKLTLSPLGGGATGLAAAGAF
jgi:hypothetical protein